MRQAVRRSGGQTVGCLAALALALTASPPDRLTAQVPDTAAAPAAPVVTTGAVVVPTDTSRRIKPLGAFWRSFLLPGWGQARTGRATAGAVFAAWEGTCAMMTLKAQSEANYLKQVGSKNLLGAKRQEVQDWLVLWIFNHLFSGAEAFVSAHLQDFPKELKVRAMPNGVGITVPVPRP
jgi:hypothetical protein